MTTKHIPDGCHTANPYLMVHGAPKLIEFLTQTFDAKELHRSVMPNGTIMNADLQLGDSRIMIAEAPGGAPPMPGQVYLYVPDCDASYERALQAGAVSIMVPSDRHFGDRLAGVRDALGNHWWIATHIEDVSPEELERRLKNFGKQQA